MIRINNIRIYVFLNRMTKIVCARVGARRRYRHNMDLLVSSIGETRFWVVVAHGRTAYTTHVLVLNFSGNETKY